MIKSLTIFKIIIFFIVYNSNENQCPITAKIANTTICMPTFKEYENLMNKSKNSYQSDLDLYKKNSLSNNSIIIGYYAKNSHDFLIDEENFVFYYHRGMTADISKKYFEKLSTDFNQSFKSKSEIDLILAKLENNFNSIQDTPVVIENYKINDNSETYIIIFSVFNGSKWINIIKTLNFIYVKKKIVMMNFTMNYKNNESVNNLKQKNDYVIHRFINENI